MCTSKQRRESIKREPTPVVIVGKNQLHNDLLQSYIESAEGYSCACRTGIGHDFIDMMNIDEAFILIIDANYIDISRLNNGDRIVEAVRHHRCHPILFNVDAEQQIESEAICYGIKGIFYLNEPIEHLMKGLSAVMAGELWYPRKALSDYVLSIKNKKAANDPELPQVTQREREILLKLSAGASNQEIADHLNISPHTVKTHIYNCYKKIGVSNRLQATVWASHHL
jgi:LuxR family transcriptional regulator, positive regulator of biofilm formation